LAVDHPSSPPCSASRTLDRVFSFPFPDRSIGELPFPYQKSPFFPQSSCRLAGFSPLVFYVETRANFIFSPPPVPAWNLSVNIVPSSPFSSLLDPSSLTLDGRRTLPFLPVTVELPPRWLPLPPFKGPFTSPFIPFFLPRIQIQSVPIIQKDCFRMLPCAFSPPSFSYFLTNGPRSVCCFYSFPYQRFWENPCVVPTCSSEWICPALSLFSVFSRSP